MGTQTVPTLPGLIEWMAVERGEDGRVFVPWDEIDVHLPLTGKAA